MDNDALARAEFSKGHAFERAVAEFFRAHGLCVTVGKQSIRDDVSERHAYKGEVDLTVNGMSVEVKSRNLRKWWPTMNLCSLSSWDDGKQWVDAWVILNRNTGEMRVCSGVAARKHAFTEETKDPGRNIKSYRVVRIALSHLRPVSALIEYAKNQESDSQSTHS